MSARSTRAATAGSLALALALALPAAAFADEGERGRSDAPAERSEDRGRSETAPHGSAEGRQAPAAEGGRSRTDSGPAGEDPGGNNGTVKVDGEAFDDGRGTEPHVGCVLELDFYGFDAGDTATITFTGQAPTGGGLLHSESGTLISDDAAGGGQDRDATLRYSVDDQLSELLHVAPHAQQGWHVKVAVDVDGAPGGAKQKVVWIDCPASGAAAPTITTDETAPSAIDTPTSGTTSGAASGTGSPLSVVAPTGVLPATLVSGTTVAAAERQDALTLGAAGAALAAGTVPAQGAGAAAVLPFTGAMGLLWLLATGLAAVGVGSLAHRLGRRSATG